MQKLNNTKQTFPAPTDLYSLPHEKKVVFETRRVDQIAKKTPLWMPQEGKKMPGPKITLYDKHEGRFWAGIKQQDEPELNLRELIG
jgi:hypothetical protein